MAAPLEVRSMAGYLQRKGYVVYCVRLKGHGTAPSDLNTVHWEDWCKSINAGYAIVSTFTDHVVLGGFSMGAGLALLSAARKGQRIAGVFAVDAPLYLRNQAAKLAPSIKRMNAVLERLHWRRAQWEYFENEPENRHINYMSNPVSGVAELGRAMNAMYDALPQISVPALIVQGSRDPVVHPASGQYIFDRLGTARKELLILERTRHGIVNGPGSIQLFERVSQFVESVLGGLFSL